MVPTHAPSRSTTSASSGSTPHVVVLGGGIAGLHATTTLTRQSDAAITIVEPTAHHQFLTRLAAVAGGTQPIGDAAQPLSAMVPDATIEPHRALDLVETPRGVTVALDDGRELAADAVIVAAGAEASLPPITGSANAHTLRSARDALGIRAALDGDGRKPSDGLVVVGAGATGCQLAAAAAHALPGLAVTIVDADDRVLPAFRPALGHRAALILADRGVEVRLGQSVERINKSGLRLSAAGERAKGEVINGTVVWAAGFTAQGDTLGLDATRDGRIVIDDLGRVTASNRIFAAGDIAAHVDRRGDLRPMSAQIAAQAGRAVGANVAASLRRAEMRSLRLDDLGWVVDLGGGRGVAEVLGIPLADPISERLVPFLHTAIDYRNLFQLGGVSFMRRFGPGNGQAPSASQLVKDLDAFGLDLD